MTTERQRLERKQFLEELEAEQRAEQEKKNRPIREAEAQINDTARKLHETVKERILTQRDNEAYLDPAVANLRLPRQEAENFVKEQARKFLEENPEYYGCPENFKAITEYLIRQGHLLASAAMLKAAWLRLRQFHLIEERPEPEPEPVVQPQPEQPQQTAQMYAGVDLDTGEPRLYTQREVDLMPAEEYKRKLRLSVRAGLDAIFDARR